MEKILVIILLLSGVTFSYKSYQCNSGDTWDGYSRAYPVVDSTFKFEGENRKLIYTKDSVFGRDWQDTLPSKWGSDTVFVRVKIDTILIGERKVYLDEGKLNYKLELDTVNTAAIILGGYIDSILIGPDSLLMLPIGIQVSGNRRQSDYTQDYWQNLIGKTFLDWGRINKDQYFYNEFYGQVEYITHCRDFDDYWYFSAGDTVWNDAERYGVPLVLGPLIQELKDNLSPLNLANLDLKPKRVEVYSLIGQKIWARNFPDVTWQESVNVPMGVYHVRIQDSEGWKTRVEYLGNR